MPEPKNTFATIDAYIAAAPPQVQPKLHRLRSLIREQAPRAQERISWGMPTFYLFGNLIHFAAHARHIGLYPGTGGVAAFAGRLTGYKTSKGAIQLPLSKPLPEQLIRDIVRYRVSENLRDAGQPMDEAPHP